MAKRLRLRLSRVLPSFHGFRSKASAANPAAPAISSKFTPDPPPLPHPSLVSAACCRPSRRLSRLRDFRPPPPEAPAYLWREEEKWWHVAACPAAGYGGDDSLSSPRRKIDSDDGVFPPLVLRRGRRRKLAASRRRSSRRCPPRCGSCSSADDDDDSGWFSSDEDTAAAALMSSTDMESSDHGLRSRWRKSVGRTMWTSPEGWMAVATLISCAAPAVRESFAVAKLSEDPKGDFRLSMAEMVVEKGIFDARGLEQLLRCFLCLNSGSHHAAIMAAFKDIWDAVFPADNSVGASPRRSSQDCTVRFTGYDN